MQNKGISRLADGAIGSVPLGPHVAISSNYSVCMGPRAGGLDIPGELFEAKGWF